MGTEAKDTLAEVVYLTLC